MARRKRILEDDDSSDASADSDNADFNMNEDADERAERDLLENPYGRKRRRRGNGKDDATYGVFGDNSEEEGFGGHRKKEEKRSDWTKAPAFISSEKKVDMRDTIEENSSESSDGEETKETDEDVEDQEDTGDDSQDTGPPSPRVRMDEEEEEEELKPTIGGIGSISQRTGLNEPSSTNSNTTKSGIGANRGGIGSKSASTEARSTLPTAFGAARSQRAFVRDSSNSAPGTRAATPLSTSEQIHFNKLSGSFGARMLSKMGWQAGAGLGTDGTGIVTPVESKLRPKGMGIAFKGFKEKTEQSKAEARRRGEVVSDDEQEKKAKRKNGQGKGSQQAERADAWKKPKKQKIKVEHKSYEQIIAESGIEAPTAGVGMIIDATGATLREVSSLADVSLASWTPSTDPTRIPEVRHNLRLIAEACKIDLEGLAREAKALEARKKWIQEEDMRLRKRVEDEAELIRRLQGVHLVVDEVNSKAKEAAISDYEPSLEPFSSVIEKLSSEYSKEYERYHLDEIVIAAVLPTFRRMMTTWKPLEEPSAYTDTLRRWRGALKMSTYDAAADMQVDTYGAKTVSSRPLQTDVPMTPYESLLWSIWLPKVRSAINNDWSPTSPSPAIKLLESWSDILPQFIKDNLMDQLILPKVSSAISNWNSKRSDVSLQAIVFPWLPHIGLRMESFIDDARRKVKSMLRSWTPKDGVPKDLLPWKEVFNRTEWEDMLLKYVVPKLGSLLRDDFRVNPRNQIMDPLNQVFAWSSILRQSILAQLLETEFFPKWLDILYIWLIQPQVKYGEIADWFTKWKEAFPEDVRNIPDVERGFVKGLQLMDEALQLGADAPTKLHKPSHSIRPEDNRTGKVTKEKERPLPSRAQEITFRSLVEEFAASHNLLFLPAGKVHEKSRLPLFRVAKSVEGRGGLLVYLLDEAVWAASPEGADDDYRAITLEDMVIRATKGK